MGLDFDLGDIGKEVDKALGRFVNSSQFRNSLTELLTNSAFEGRLADALKDIIDKIINSREFKKVIEAITDVASPILEPLKDLYRLILDETLKLLADDADVFTTLFRLLGDTFDRQAVASALKEFLTKPNFLRVRSEIFGRLLGLLFDNGIPDAGRSLLKSIVHFVIQQCAHIFRLLDPLGNVSIPKAVSQGPNQAMRLLADFKTFKHDIFNDEYEITDRLLVVTASLKRLIELIDRAGADSDFLFGLTVEEFNLAFAAAYDGNGYDLKQLIKRLVDPAPIFEKIAAAFANGSFWSWAEFPTSASVGVINDWINDSNASIDERPFRLKFVAAFDEYFRQHVNGQTGMRQFGERNSSELIVDLLIVFCDTVIGYILVPIDYPRIEDEWDGFEDIGSELGDFMSQQMRAPIRIAVGTILRGIWLWTVQNTNIIEGVATLIAAVFSSIANGVIRNVFWSVRVMSVYREANGASWRPYGLSGDTIDQWESKEVVNGPASPIKSTLGYVVIRRHGTTTTPVAIPSNIASLLRDYGAYLDMMYYKYLERGGFRKAVGAPELLITRAEVRGSKLTVHVQVESPAEGPRCVVRLFAAGNMYVMAPFDNETYSFVKNNFSFANSIRTVVAVSSNGSFMKRIVTRI